MSTGVAPREGRRIVTALFADVVGSTALGETLDPEDFMDIVGQAVGRIVVAVEGSGGSVHKLLGDGVLGLFGVPAANEDDAERAVQAGLRITADIAAYAREVTAEWALEGFDVRVGIETGLVVLGQVGAGRHHEYGVAGDAVNTAARLQAAADPGMVLVGQATQRLVAGAFAWAEPRTLQLKGKGRDFRAWPVTGAGTGRPEDGGAATVLAEAARLVDRDAELEAVRAAAGALRTGHGGLIVIEGEAGMGKTRLIAESRALVQNTLGVRWLAAACGAGVEAAPHEPVRELLRPWLGPAAGDVEAAAGPALERLLGAERAAALRDGLALALGLSPGGGAAGQSADARHYAMAESVGAVVAALAAERPTVVAVDDLHWADTALVRLLERLAGLAAELPLLVLTAQRPDLDAPSARLAELAAEKTGGGRLLRLPPLGADGARLLLEELVGSSVLPHDLERRVLDTADGNPYFLGELLRSLVDAGALVRTGTGWRLDQRVPVEVPHTVERVLLARLDRLDPPAAELLLAASVLGRRFDVAVLEAVAGSGDARVRLKELERLGLVESTSPPGACRFTHALIRDVAYDSMLRRRRRALHRKAAEALTAAPGDWPERDALLAVHWEQAGDLVKAGDHAVLAARKAVDRLAFEEAAGHLDLAVRVRGDASPSALLPLVLELAATRRRAGLLDPALASYDEAAAFAIRVRDATALATAALGYEDALFASRRPRPPGDRSVELLRAAAAALTDANADRALRARVEAALGQALVYGGHVAEGAAVATAAVELADQAGNPAAVAAALIAWRAGQQGPDRLEARLAATLRAARAADVAADEGLYVEAVRLGLVDLLQAGQLDEADEAVGAVAAMIEHAREPLYLWYPPMWRAMRALFDGRLDTAARCVERFRVVGRRVGYADVEKVYALQLFLLRRERGDLGALRPLLERMAPSVSGAGDPNFDILLGLADLDAGDPAAARAMLGELAGAGFERQLRNQAKAPLLALAAEGCARLGITAAVAPVTAELAPWAGRNLVVGSGAACAGSATHYLGLMAALAGDLDLAVERLEAAGAQHEAWRVAPYLARSRAAEAAVRTRRGAPGDAGRAATLLGEARAVATAAGLDPGRLTRPPLPEEG